MINIVELFSGIGSQARALENIFGKKNVNVEATCEWDIHAFLAYHAIHVDRKIPAKYKKLTKEELLEDLKNYTFSNNGKAPLLPSSFKSLSLDILQRIKYSIDKSHNFVDINALKGDNLSDNVDMLTYSFPCQDLSNVGAFHGYNKGIDIDSGSRSSLIWQVGRILTEMNNLEKTLPKFLLMENVPSLLSDRHKANFDKWIDLLSNLGYESYYYRLNAHDFGLPQNRPRLLMISVYTGDNKEFKNKVNDFFLFKTSNTIVDEYRSSKYYRKITMQDLLKLDYSNTSLFNEACESCPNNTPSRLKIWNENPQLVLKGNVINPVYEMIRTLTTKQDRHPNSGNIYFESGIEGRSYYRFLTPRECLLFMGFTDKDYDNIQRFNTYKNGTTLFPRDNIIHMAGNSIPVKLLEGVFYQVKLLYELLYGNK